MATQTIDTTIFSSSHPDIEKRTSISGTIVSCIILLASILVFVSTFEMHDYSSTISMGLMVLGTALFLVGVFRFFWNSKEIVYLPTGSVVHEQSVFFDLRHIDKLVNMVKNGNSSNLMEIAGGTGGNLRLDVVLSEDRKFVALQLFQFVPYTYNPVTSVCYYKNSEAASIASFVVKCKMR